MFSGVVVGAVAGAGAGTVTVGAGRVAIAGAVVIGEGFAAPDTGDGDEDRNILSKNVFIYIFIHTQIKHTKIFIIYWLIINVRKFIGLFD